MDGDQIAAINQQVREQETDPELAELASALKQSQLQAEHELSQRRILHNKQRHFRKQQRLQAEELPEKKTHSVGSPSGRKCATKRQLQCLKQEWEQRIAALQHRLDHKLMRIEQLKQQRKQRSAALQKNCSPPIVLPISVALKGFG